MCTVRPSLGHEAEEEWGYYGFSISKQRKRIGVLGGGPSGLQFAVIAAQKGHDVLLWEKNRVLGGAVVLASKVEDGEDELLRPVRYLENECRRAGVRIELGFSCGAETLREAGLDMIVVATGASFKSMAPMHCLSPDTVMLQAKKPGTKVVIIGGDGVGLAAAVYILRHGEHEVTIIEQSGRLGRDVSPFYLWRYIELFKERGVTLLTRATASGWGSSDVFVTSAKGNRVIKADDVVVALREADERSALSFAQLAPEVHVIGDAKRPRRLHNAIHDGYRLGMRI
jgi:2,4-dienoyl-CoA reductase (NADPH2)